MSEPPLDLSTCWPVPPLPVEVWQRLAQGDDGLVAAAANYYGNRNLLPVAGVQGAIRMLPHLFPPAMVAAIGPLAHWPANMPRHGSAPDIACASCKAQP